MVALRAAMETVDSEGLAASAAAAVQVGLLLCGESGQACQPPAGSCRGCMVAPAGSCSAVGLLLSMRAALHVN